MKQPTKRANAAKTAFLLLYSYWVTGVACLKVWYLSFQNIKERRCYDSIIHHWSMQLIKAVNIQYQIINKNDTKPTPEKPTILMCNHSSLYDIPLSLVAMQGSVRMLTKKELFRIPIFGLGMRSAEFISIDRQNREQAIKDLAAAREKMESGILLWIAPEGTRSTMGNLLPFKKGCFRLAIETGAEIIPIGIRGINGVLPAKTFRFHLNMPVEFHIGAAIDASQFTMEQRAELAQKVRQQILELTDQSDEFLGEVLRHEKHEQKRCH